jgi:hypothetical protein
MIERVRMPNFLKLQKKHLVVKNNCFKKLTAINFILPSSSKIECEFEFTKYSRGAKLLFTIH